MKQIEPGNDKEIIDKLKSLNIYYTIKNLEIYVPLFLKTVIKCEEKAETVAKILVKLPEGIVFEVALNDYQEIVMHFLFNLQDSEGDGSGKIKLYRSLIEENFNNQKEVINMLTVNFEMIKEMNTTQSALFLLQYVEGCSKFLKSESLSVNAQRKVNEVVEMLTLYAADRKVKRETGEVLKKILQNLRYKRIEEDSEEIDEVFKKIVRSVENDEEIVARVINKNYRR